MMDSKMITQDSVRDADRDVAGGTVERKDATRVISRRAILTGAAVAMPTILTLHSGAALANASNGLIGGASGTANTGTKVYVNGQYEYVCLATTGQTSGVYDLPYPSGNPATGIPAGVKFKDKSVTPNVDVYGDDMCRKGGTFRYQSTDYYVPKGMLLSATAYSSLSAAGVIDTKFLSL
jgi:hypothetical protein